jgi:tetratricopeptide (TPR) repeat protein
MGKRREVRKCYDVALKWGAKTNNFGEEHSAPRLGPPWLHRDPVTRSEEAEQLCDRAWALVSLSQYPEALKCYDQALQLNQELGQKSGFWLDHGLALAGLGRSRDALQLWDKAVAIDPALHSGWFNKGLIHLAYLQEYREALECFLTAQRLGSEEARPYIRECERLLG